VDYFACSLHSFVLAGSWMRVGWDICGNLFDESEQLIVAFSALTVLVGRQERHPAR